MHKIVKELLERNPEVNSDLMSSLQKLVNRNKFPDKYHLAVTDGSLAITLGSPLKTMVIVIRSSGVRYACTSNSFDDTSPILDVENFIIKEDLRAYV